MNKKQIMVVALIGVLAIVVALIILFVLFYLGTYLGYGPGPGVTITQCTFPPGFTCVTNKLQAGTSKLYLKIGQGTGHIIQINGINCTQQIDTIKMTSGLYISYNNYNAAGATKTINMSSGSIAVLADAFSLYPEGSVSPANATNIYCTTSSGELPSGMEAGSQYNGRIYINYTEFDTNITKIIFGTYTARYEA